MGLPISRLFYENSADDSVWVYTPTASGVQFVDIGTVFLENSTTNDSTIYGGSNIDVLNGLILFDGTWKNGTAGQLDVYNVNSTASPYGLTTTMFFGNASSSIGLDPQDFVNMAGPRAAAFFVGQDATHGATLWETDGTYNGTVEVMVGNAPVRDNGQMTVLDNPNGIELYFNDPGQGLGVFDPSSLYNRTTGSVSVVSGTNGLNPFDTFAPQTYTPGVGSDLFFSDGIRATANAGTPNSQIAGSGDLYYYGGSGNAVDLTALSGGKVYNAEDMVAIVVGLKTDVFFNGTDSNGKQDLWEISDGSNGTPQLTEISTQGAKVNGTLGLDPQSITAFNNNIYFAGTDTSLGSGPPGDGLWVYTPGASAAHEVVTANRGTLSANNYDLSIGGSTPSVNDSVYNPQSEISVVGGDLYFAATHGSTDGGIFAYTPGSNANNGTVSDHIGSLGASPNPSAEPMNLTGVRI
jgi:hypothetical protein